MPVAVELVQGHESFILPAYVENIIDTGLEKEYHSKPTILLTFLFPVAIIEYRELRHSLRGLDDSNQQNDPLEAIGLLIGLSKHSEVQSKQENEGRDSPV